MLLRVLSIVFMSLTETYAQCYLLPDDTRNVNGTLGSQFKITTMLPGVYDTVSNLSTTKTIVDGDCSMALFQCIYTQTLENQATAVISGTISDDLKWIIFTSSVKADLMPIGIAFFPNNQWLDNTEGALLPKPGASFNVHTNGVATRAIIKFDISGANSEFSVLAHRDSKTIYAMDNNGTVIVDVSTTDPAIISLGDELNGNVRTVQLTVQKHFNIDMYSCTNSKGSMTYIIDWMKPKDGAMHINIASLLVFGVAFLSIM